MLALSLADCQYFDISSMKLMQTTNNKSYVNFTHRKYVDIISKKIFTGFPQDIHRFSTAIRSSTLPAFAH
jgi:hypothetical protein